MVKCRLDHRKFEDMNQSLARKLVIDKLIMYFELINTFRIVCTQMPPISYLYHVELRVLTKEMENMEMTYVYQWKMIKKFGRTKYKLHQ